MSSSRTGYLFTGTRCLLTVVFSDVLNQVSLYENFNAMTKMIKIIKFGEDVQGYNIPVLNEREIRAAAGILFLFMFISVSIVLAKENFVPLKYAILIFLTDMLIRVFISPRFSPSLILGRLIVRNQSPEYVGAAQKKFAWIIGVVIAGTMFTLQIVANTYGPITGIMCFVCLIFLFFEAAFGICLGCKFYPLFHKGKIQYCSGEICDVTKRSPIQKISFTQVFIVIGFMVYIFLAVSVFKDEFSKKPHALFEIPNPPKSE